MAGRVVLIVVALASTIAFIVGSGTDTLKQQVLSVTQSFLRL